MDTGLKNRVALVAASSQGIGRAIAEALAAEGCRIAMCARRAEALQAVADQIRKQHRAQVFALPVDVTDPQGVHEFVNQTVSQFGGVDVCVTNAGGPPAKGFLAASLEDWRSAVAANFLSVVYFAREVIPHMQSKRWGRIITITSISTKQPVSDLVLSNAVRAAVVGLVRSLANEFGKDGILVNNVGPGYTAQSDYKTWPRAGLERSANRKRKWLRAGRRRRRSSASVSHGRWPIPSSGWPPNAPPTSRARLFWWMVEPIRGFRIAGGILPQAEPV